MKNQATTKEQIREQLVKVFCNAAQTTIYNSQNEQYTGLCGWCGVMAPESRPAYVKTFGAAVVAEAEEGAREDIANLRNEYERSEWASRKAEADNHRAAGQPVPTVGAYVWGSCTWCKCDGGKGYIDEIQTREELADIAQDALLHVEKVITVTADELDRPELADELCAADRLPGGGCYEDNEQLQALAPYHLSYTKVTAVTDGTRYYYIDSEGYDYARYVAMPDAWEDMFAPALQTIRDKENARKEAAEAKAAAERSAAIAEYVERCGKWAKYMQPVTELEKTVSAANYGTPEYKAARRKLQSVRRANILTMCRRAFPGVKFGLTQCKGWGKSWELTYTDGPTEAALTAAVDLDLFATNYDTFDGWDDSSDNVRIEEAFCAFARAYMGNDCGRGIKVIREMSEDTAATLRAQAIAAVPALANGESIHRDQLTDAQRTAVYDLVGPDRARVWYHADSLAREIFARTDYYITIEPTTPTEPTTTAKADTTDGAADATAPDPTAQDAAPYKGLQLVEIADGVAVVGSSRATYCNRKAIKAHGATWNKETKQWQATTPEAVARLRDWFAPACA